MDAENPYFKSKYATLESCWNACRDLLSSNGLAVVQSPGSDGNGRIVVRSTLIHTSGEWISASVSLKPVKDDPQAAGSAITYGRRYGLCALVGIVTNDDDDGNYATQPTGKDYTRADALKAQQKVADEKNRKAQDLADEVRKKREAAQAQAQKRADAEALVKDVADTLGAEVVTADRLVNEPTPTGGRRENPEYKTKDKDMPPVKIEARFLRKQGRAWLYQLTEDGVEVGELYLPPSQVHSSDKNFVWISKWIAEQKIKDGKLQPEQVIWKEHDEARGDAWEPPPSDSTDVEY
jgi:hypothetical protein